ncbi:MAG TPA: tetratricopeptide repeat protein [Candidatus Nitrosotalea sp.]|nr:tetratricopeptide repeat protein [Candidatus Nitrosotalea sp.]
MSGIHFSSDDEEISLDYIYNIGLGHAKRGKPKDAIFYFDKVLMVEPNHVNALLNKGNALGKLGKYEDAITVYDRLLKKNPSHPVCLLNKGLALHYLQKYDKAIACYDKIPPPQSENPSVLYHKACSKALQKNIIDSLELLERAIVLDPEYANKASKDKDFDIFRNDDRFKALVT